jgi:ketosteroid isomerase-like protein
MSDNQDIIDTALEIIEAFSKNDRKRYFDMFVPEATFIFYTVPRLLNSRAAYEAEWDAWIKNFEFHVINCVSAQHSVQVYGNFAIFTHETTTHVSTKNGEQITHERETIIFQKIFDKWLGVHEHLSLLPN